MNKILSSEEMILVFEVILETKKSKMFNKI